jgi:putative transposase
MVDEGHSRLSIARQCELLTLPRSSYYYETVPESAKNLSLMRRLDELYLQYPFYGSRRMVEELAREGISVNRKRVQRLMRQMGLEAIYPKRRHSKGGEGHKIFPYLLRNVAIERVDQVWSTDITYIPMPSGYLYLTAVIDWYSRYVLSWRLSNSLESSFCLDALEEALRGGRPEIFNTDQGVQFTSAAFVGMVQSHGIQMSMDGKGRALDNVFVERLWRSLKYEEVYLKSYADGREAHRSLEAYFEFYCHKRVHQGLDYKTPAEVYWQTRKSGRQTSVMTCG